MGSVTMKVGDLITMKQHCKDSGRLAIVISLAKWDNDCCYIAFMDEPTKRIACNLNNIIKLN